MNAFETMKPLLDKMIVVKEEWIALAILRLVEQEKCVVEGKQRKFIPKLFYHKIPSQAQVQLVWQQSWLDI